MSGSLLRDDNTRVIIGAQDSVTSTAGVNLIRDNTSQGLWVHLVGTDAVTLTVSGTVTANLSAVDNAVLDAIQAAVEIMDDWDETNRAAVNLIASQAGITGGAGAVAANTPRMTLASDDPAVALLGTIDADTSTLAAIDFMIGTDFSNVFGSSSLIGSAGTAATGVLTIQGIASMTPLLVDGSATTQPVSGTVTANLSATDNTVLDNIDANTTNLQLAGDGVKTITSAGTDEALAGSTTCKKAVIQAQTDNTGLIAIGATGVDATEATGTGIILYAGDTITVYETNLADIFVDATVSGEGVRFLYYN